MKFLAKVGCLIGYLVCTYLLALQLAFFLSFKYDLLAWQASYKFCLDPKILFWQGNNNYFKLVFVLIAVGALYLIYRIFLPSKSERERKKAERSMTRNENANFTHIANKHEAKKGLQRLQYDKNGELNHYDYSKPVVLIGQLIIISGIALIITAISLYIYSFVRLTQTAFNGVYDADNANILLLITGVLAGVYGILSKGHIRDYCDFVFDPFKKWWNSIVVRFHLGDNHKFNTLKLWNINGHKTYRRSGVPVLTNKRESWVDAEDSHTLIDGTTNSGKTFSIIHEMIEEARMTGESIIVNDLKGELATAHYTNLINSGYKVRFINFVNPAKSDEWNPFKVIYDKYRESEAIAIADFKANASPERLKDYEYYLELKKRLYKYSAMKKAQAEQRPMLMQLLGGKGFKSYEEDIRITKRAIDRLYMQMPRPDFSTAFELLRDLANTLCAEPNAKEQFWSQSSRGLLEGLVCFLLEYEYLDANDNVCRLESDQINFKALQTLVDDGQQYIREDYMLFNYYIDTFKEPNDQSVLYLKSFIQAPPETRGSIAKHFSTKIDLGIINDNITKLTSHSSFDLKDIAKKKTAVFLIVHDEKSTYYPMITLFISQLYQQLVDVSRDYPKRRLPIPVRILWDEFGISPALKDIDQLLSASRFMGVTMTMVVQNLSQIDAKYGKDMARGLKNNVMNFIFLLAGEETTLKEVSEMAGNTLVWNKEKGMFETRKAITPDRLRRLSKGDAVVIRQRCNPVITHYLPYNKYVFYNVLHGDKDLPNKMLDDIHLFSLSMDFEELTENGLRYLARLKDKEKELDAILAKQKEELDNEFNKHRTEDTTEEETTENVTVDAETGEVINNSDLVDAFVGKIDNQQDNTLKKGGN